MSARSIPTCAVAAAAPTQCYRLRRPEHTVLYRLVQQPLETWLAGRREADPEGIPVPAYVERALRGYLTCGILAHGFARARCAECGHDFLIAFSCKGRGVCPSCTTRRMAELAAHLTEQVFPRVPVRQWVVTLPKRLRYFLHRDPVLLSRLRRVALGVIATRLRRACAGAPSAARFGAVSFAQRFGSTLNAHTHLHVCVTDGVFSADGAGIRFHPAVLSESDITTVQRTIRQRVLRAAVRHGCLTEEAATDLRGWEHGPFWCSRRTSCSIGSQY